MEIQSIIIFILFVGATAYIGRSIYRSFAAKKGCGTSCKCGVDFSNVETKKS